MEVKLAVTLFLTTTIFCTNIMGQSTHQSTSKTSIDSLIESKMKETGIVGIGASMNEKDEGKFFDVYEELYKYAQTLKLEKTTSHGQ